MFDFDQILLHAELSTLKWRNEIERMRDPSLLCFGTANMDFKAPPAVLAALERVLHAGHLGYPYKRQSYYDAIQGFYARRFGWAVQKEWIRSHATHTGGQSACAPQRPL